MNKQIKELEEYLKYITQHKTWTIKKLAQQLTKQGYQKVDKDSVVISNRDLDYSIGEIWKQARKQTTREILKEFLIEFVVYSCDDDYYTATEIDKKIREFAKRYGVD